MEEFLLIWWSGYTDLSCTATGTMLKSEYERILRKEEPCTGAMLNNAACLLWRSSVKTRTQPMKDAEELLNLAMTRGSRFARYNIAFLNAWSAPSTHAVPAMYKLLETGSLPPLAAEAAGFYIEALQTDKEKEWTQRLHDAWARIPDNRIASFVCADDRTTAVYVTLQKDPDMKTYATPWVRCNARNVNDAII